MPPLDPSLQLPQGGFQIVKCVRQLLDFADRKIPMPFFARPECCRAYSNHASIYIEPPPSAVGEPVALIAQRDCLPKALCDVVGFGQPARMRSGVLVAKLLHELRPLSCGHAVFRQLAEIRLASDDAKQISDTMLEPRVREHHADERAREGPKASIIRIGKKDSSGVCYHG
jgi:hypothetical protein